MVLTRNAYALQYFLRKNENVSALLENKSEGKDYYQFALSHASYVLSKTTTTHLGKNRL